MAHVKRDYRVHYIPLESDPEIFTKLIHALGVPENYNFTEIISLDDHYLALVPRPCRALVLAFPTSIAYDCLISSGRIERDTFSGSGPNEDVMWFKQTIHNACGLYGILHAVANGLPVADLRE